MDPIERIAAAAGVDTRGSFSCPTERDQTIIRLRPSLCTTTSNATAQVESSENRNVAAILRSDGESNLPHDSYFGSSSFDGAVTGFWPLIWDSLEITWAPKIYHHFVDWSYRHLIRAALLLLRKAWGPARPFMNIEGYPREVAIVLIKNTLKSWLNENSGFCILIGGPVARAPSLQTIKYYIRCFGEIRFRSSGRSCVIDAACNAMYLLLGDSKASSMSS